jgi:hypothetical protein
MPAPTQAMPPQHGYLSDTERFMQAMMNTPYVPPQTQDMPAPTQAMPPQHGYLSDTERFMQAMMNTPYVPK